MADLAAFFTFILIHEYIVVKRNCKATCYYFEIWSYNASWFINDMIYRYKSAKL